METLETGRFEFVCEAVRALEAAAPDIVARMLELSKPTSLFVNEQGKVYSERNLYLSK